MCRSSLLNKVSSCQNPLLKNLLLPYSRGDLVSRIHDKGEVISVEHTGEGTMVHARVSEAFAGELELYVLAGLPERD